MAVEKIWKIREVAYKETVRQLASELGVDPVLAELLVQRGVHTFEQARSFFRPSLENLHDPFLMKDMDKAVERVHEAVSSGEKILVYGDYDVDGTTAVSLVYSFLRRLTRQVDFYIPERYDEGYGVSYKGIDWASENDFGLIITLDCGIKANEKVDYAAGKGIDMIICDHHLPENELPKAVAVLDPKREDCHYPFDDLSGCGVGFKLVQAYSQAHGIDFDTLIPLLDLLVVSIASDLVSVTGENRILAHYGLFKGVRNYIAIVGRETKELPEKAGYYGERIVLKAQMLGLNTCWVAATYSKRKSRIAVAEGERVVCVIAVGYGATQGRPHRNRPVSALCRVEREPAPDWFYHGVEAAMLAPTAVNRQQFCITWTGDGVKAQATAGGLARLDLGIVKYHFEIGAGRAVFDWNADE